MPALRQAARVWQYNVRVVRRQAWEHLFFLAEPFLFLGLSSALAPVVGPISGVSYAAFVGPALAVGSAMIESGVDMSWATHRRLDRSKVYEGIVTSPAEPSDVALGEVLWGATRALVYGGTFLLTLVAIGVVRSPAALAAPLVLLLVGAHFAATGAGAAAMARDSEQVNMYRTYYVNPQFFFAGVFFPVEVLPPVVRAIVWCMPLHHGVEAIRDLSLGGVDVGTLGHLTWLVVTLAVVVPGVARLLRRRLVA